MPFVFDLYLLLLNILYFVFLNFIIIPGHTFKIPEEILLGVKLKIVSSLNKRVKEKKRERIIRGKRRERERRS